MIQFGRKRPGRPPAVARRTSLSFTADELAALGQLLAAGQVVLQPRRRLPVIARLKAAMTRLGAPMPAGL
jgi:hypothetical protein